MEANRSAEELGIDKHCGHSSAESSAQGAVYLTDDVEKTEEAPEEAHRGDTVQGLKVNHDTESIRGAREGHEVEADRGPLLGHDEEDILPVAGQQRIGSLCLATQARSRRVVPTAASGLASRAASREQHPRQQTEAWNILGNAQSPKFSFPPRKNNSILAEDNICDLFILLRTHKVTPYNNIQVNQELPIISIIQQGIPIDFNCLRKKMPLNPTTDTVEGPGAQASPAQAPAAQGSATQAKKRRCSGTPATAPAKKKRKLRAQADESENETPDVHARYSQKRRMAYYEAMIESVKHVLRDHPDLCSKIGDRAVAHYNQFFMNSVQGDDKKDEMIDWFVKDIFELDFYLPASPSDGSRVNEAEELESCCSRGVVLSKSPEHSWEYVLYCKSNTQTHPLNQGIPNHTTQLPGSYVKRAEANAKLDETTSYDHFDGGMAAVSRRHAYEHTPYKLLKVELTLSTGEERVLWVERRLVNLAKDLTQKERSLKKWSAPRPKLPHYIVECEFMTQGTTETPQQQLSEDDDANDDGDAAGLINHGVVGAYTGDIKLERLPLVTFTERGLANDHAGALFLRHSAVSEAIRGPLDDFWWANNAVPIHREAEKAAKAPDARYVAELYTYDMRTRLGFDSIRVAVYTVDDVLGPLNI
ncbi:hypothetical protein F4677DRAFT_446842 [Hypoxylon crocopeplum]|nr:hypothetical protein F4677DRAFT_446842 [Hypoxylon crocopeplum]